MKHMFTPPPLNRCLPLFLLITACVEPEISPRAPSPDPARVPHGEHLADEDLGEDPHMLALARQHPSFAGMFFEPGTGRLVVASTSTDARDAAAVRQTVLTAVGTELGHPPAADGELALNAVHRVFEYSFLELARHRARIRSHIFGIPGVQSLSVDEQHNRIKVGLLDPSARVKVEELAIDLAIPIQMLSFAQASPVHPMYGTSRSTPPRPHMSSGPTLRDVISVPDDKLRGGYMVQAEGAPTSHLCTLGFTAVVGSIGPGGIPSYFVTNSHCSRYVFYLDHGYWNQPDNKRGPERRTPKHRLFPRGVGIESKDPNPRVHPCDYDLCRDSDASLVKTHWIHDVGNPPLPRLIALGEIGRTTERSNCSLCEAPITIDTINPTIRIVRTRNSIVDGEELDKIGQRTGWTYGNVEDTCVDLDDFTGVRILCTGKIRFSLGRGDSGSPVFQYDSGKARLVGIVWGGEEWDNQLSRVGLISPFGQIKKDLGEFLKVCNYVQLCEDPI